VDYYTMIRSRNHQFDLRLDIVIYARRHSIRKTATHFHISRNTVRKWVRRFEQEGKAGLEELSRAPNHCPHKTPWQTERQIIRLRQRTHFSAQRLKDEFDIKAGRGAIGRIIRQHDLTKRPRRKPHRKRRDLRAQKMAQPPLTHLQMDTKDLSDIPAYRKQMFHVGLPRYQFTVRDECTGAHFLTYGSELCVTYAELTARRLLQHGRHCGIEMSDLVLATDNGTEFSGNRLDHCTNGFVHTVESEFGATHVFNRVARPNDNADVESVHGRIEAEFYELESFSSLSDFIAKAALYQHYYNLARWNYSKGKKSPLDILRERDTTISPRVFILPPVVFGTPPRHRARDPGVGHDVPALAETACKTGQDMAERRGRQSRA
jgi:transposase